MILLYIWAGFCTFLISVLFHELGHLTYLRGVFGKNIPLYVNLSEIVVGDDKHYKNLSKEDYKNMILKGILWGAVPLAIFSLLVDLGWLLIIPYLIGCNSDFDALNSID